VDMSKNLSEKRDDQKPEKKGNFGLGLTRPVSVDTGGRVSLLFLWHAHGSLDTAGDVAWHDPCQLTRVAVLGYCFSFQAPSAWHGPCQVRRVAVSAHYFTWHAHGAWHGWG
jgi:hypothetical protein